MGKEYQKTVLFGLHKKSVDHFLKKLHHLQELELLELKDRIKQAQEKDAILKKELNQLRDRLPQKEPVKPSLKVITFNNAVKENSVVKIPVGSQPNPPEKEAEDPPAPVQLEQAIEEVEQDDGQVLDHKELYPSGELDHTLPYSVSNPAVRSDIGMKANSFWGDMDEFMDEDVLTSNDWFSFSPREMKPSVRMEEPSHQSSNYVEETAASLQEEETEIPTEAEEVSIEESTEIEKIKRNYIVGKLAGDHLLDSRGRLIIAKDAVIQEDTIKRAQQEGKLAELIVNMVLPRMDE